MIYCIPIGLILSCCCSCLSGGNEEEQRRQIEERRYTELMRYLALRRYIAQRIMMEEGQELLERHDSTPVNPGNVHQGTPDPQHNPTPDDAAASKDDKAPKEQPYYYSPTRIMILNSLIVYQFAGLQ